MREATKYVWIAYITARSHIAYAGEVLTRIVLMTVILYVFSRVWLAVYGANGGARLAGLTLPQMIWYLVAAGVVFFSALWTQAVALIVFLGIVGAVQKAAFKRVFTNGG